jgi:hypothetical protein
MHLPPLRWAMLNSDSTGRRIRWKCHFNNNNDEVKYKESFTIESKKESIVTSVYDRWFYGNSQEPKETKHWRAERGRVSFDSSRANLIISQQTINLTALSPRHQFKQTFRQQYVEWLECKNVDVVFTCTVASNEDGSKHREDVHVYRSIAKDKSECLLINIYIKRHAHGSHACMHHSTPINSSLYSLI